MKNWKTTLIGICTAVFTVIWPMIQSGNVTIKEIGIAAGLALLGYFSKDAGVTGTSK